MDQTSSLKNAPSIITSREDFDTFVKMPSEFKLNKIGELGFSSILNLCVVDGDFKKICEDPGIWKKEVDSIF